MEGNRQKIREALELAIEVGDWCCAQTDDPLECCEFSCAYQVEPHGEAGADCPWKKIRAALAEPPHNCEVGTAEEQAKRFDDFCDAQCQKSCKSCPVYKEMTTDIECFAKWAQMPYIENGRNEK